MKGLRHIRGTAWGSSAMPPLAEVKLSEAQVAQIVDMIAQMPSEVSEHLVRNATAVFGACAQPAQPAQQAGRDGARRAQGQAPRTLLTQHRWVLLPLCRVSPASVVSHSSFLGFSRLGAITVRLCFIPCVSQAGGVAESFVSTTHAEHHHELPGSACVGPEVHASAS